MPSSWNCAGRRAFVAALAGALLIAAGLALWGRVMRAGDAFPPAAVAATLAPTTVLTSPTATPTATPTARPSPTCTDLPTASPTASPSPSATPTATPLPTPEPLPTPDGVVRRLRVPILMYHYVSAPPAGADAIRRGLSVNPEQFEEHLRYLREAGFQAISLSDLALALQIGHPLPEHPIIITFDDGYRDNYEQAFPLLKAYGFTATFFLITGPIDEGNEAYVTWDQVIEMHAARMEMGAHGHTHVDLRGRDVDYLVWQVLGSKEAIEARTGEPVRFFCYPSGKYDEQVIRVLDSADYWGAVTVAPGVEHASDAMFELARVRVPGEMTTAKLAATLRAYLDAP